MRNLREGSGKAPGKLHESEACARLASGETAKAKRPRVTAAHVVGVPLTVRHAPSKLCGLSHTQGVAREQGGTLRRAEPGHRPGVGSSGLPRPHSLTRGFHTGGRLLLGHARLPARGGEPPVDGHQRLQGGGQAHGHGLAETTQQPGHPTGDGIGFVQHSWHAAESGRQDGWSGDVATGAGRGVVEEHVDPAEVVDGLVDARLHFVEARDVAVRVRGAAAGALELGDQLLPASFRTGVEIIEL